MATTATTIRAHASTRDRLDDLRRDGETFDDLLNRLADTHADDTAPASA